MKIVSEQRIHELTVSALGLDSSAIDLFTEEAIAACIRRVASFQCPCSARKLTQSVVTVYQGLAADLNELSEKIEDTLDAMISHGDLQEHATSQNENETQSIIVYASPPAFITRKSGSAILLGIGPKGMFPLPAELETNLEISNHVRKLIAEPTKNIPQILSSIGIRELDEKHWIQSPQRSKPGELISTYDKLLLAGKNPGNLTEGLLIDSSKSVRYYRGRWTRQESQTGKFIYRRKQLYGADIWCYVGMKSGTVTNLLDLPLPKSHWRGCDEAWYLQCAIDAELGHSQEFRCRKGIGSVVIIDFFSPVPSWIRRRLNTTTNQFVTHGSLFSCSLDESEFEEESQFLQESIWLKPVTT